VLSSVIGSPLSAGSCFTFLAAGGTNSATTESQQGASSNDTARVQEYNPRIEKRMLARIARALRDVFIAAVRRENQAGRTCFGAVPENNPHGAQKLHALATIVQKEEHDGNWPDVRLNRSSPLLVPDSRHHKPTFCKRFSVRYDNRM